MNVTPYDRLKRAYMHKKQPCTRLLTMEQRSVQCQSLLKCCNAASLLGQRNCNKSSCCLCGNEKPSQTFALELCDVAPQKKHSICRVCLADKSKISQKTTNDNGTIRYSTALFVTIGQSQEVAFFCLHEQESDPLPSTNATSIDCRVTGLFNWNPESGDYIY